MPVVRDELMLAVKETDPFPPGGRKPTLGSTGGDPVLGSIDCNVHVSSPVEVLSDTVTFTRRFIVGFKSTCVAKVPKA